jgi:hypothetical protein
MVGFPSVARHAQPVAATAIANRVRLLKSFGVKRRETVKSGFQPQCARSGLEHSRGDAGSQADRRRPI